MDAIKLSTRYFELKKDIHSLKLSKEEYNTKYDSLRENGGIPSETTDIAELNTQLIELYRKKDAIRKEIDEISVNVEKLRAEKEEAIKATEDYNEKQKYFDESLLKLGEERTKLEQKLDLNAKELNEISAKHQKIQLDTTQIQETIELYRAKVHESSQFIKKHEKSSPHRPMQKYLAKIDAHGSQINAVCYGPGYQSIITVGDDKKLIQWSLPKLTEMLNISTRSVVNNIAYQQQAGLLCLSCQDKTLRILDLTTGRIISELTNHTDACNDALWISRNQLLSASKDRTIKLFDLTKNAVSSTIMAMSSVFSIAGTDQPTVFAAACFDGNIRLFDTRTKGIIHKIEKVHTRPICSLRSSITGTSIYSLGLDGFVCETSLKTMTRIRQRKDPNLEVKNMLSKMSLSLDGGYLCVPSNKGCCCLFDLLSDAPPIINTIDKAPVICSAYAGNMLVTGNSNHTLTFWV